MPKQEFEATEGLLNDVMRKQAGSVPKAVLEGVMNSVDAGAQYIGITVEEDLVRIEDDGDGMTEEEINQYFRKFGLKDDDIEDKEFGKFRMGRGQIFNFGRNIWKTNDNILVVSLDEEEVEVEVPAGSGRTETLDTSGLSYNVIDAKEHHPGCQVSVNLYQSLDAVDETIVEIENLIEYIPWLHGVTVEINGRELNQEFEPDWETEQAYFSVSQGAWGSSTDIYNKGAFVKSEQLTNTPGTIITKVDLDVNFARNDILQNDETWSNIVEEYDDFTFQTLVDHHEDLSDDEKKWVLRRSVGDDDRERLIRDLPLIPIANGETATFHELRDAKLTFAEVDNDQAEKLMKSSDFVCVQPDFGSTIRDIVDSSNVYTFGEAIDKGTRHEMKEYSYDKLKKKQQNNFDRARYFLKSVGFSGDVKPGYSNYRDVWKDDDNTVYINKSYLKHNKDIFLTTCLVKIMKEAAYSTDTRDGRSESFKFRRNLESMVDNMGEPMRELINNNAP